MARKGRQKRHRSPTCVGADEEDCGDDVVLQFFLHVTIIHSSRERNNRAKQILEEGGATILLRVRSFASSPDVRRMLLSRRVRGPAARVEVDAPASQRRIRRLGQLMAATMEREGVVEEGNNQNGKSKSGTGRHTSILTPSPSYRGRIPPLPRPIGSQFLSPCRSLPRCHLRAPRAAPNN